MEKLGALLTAVALLALGAIVLAWPVQLLWNYSLVGAIAMGCVVGGFVVGFGLIIESIRNTAKRRGR